MTREEFRIYLIEGSIIDPNDCWIWQGPYMGKGYGRTVHFQGDQSAHRNSYTVFNRSIPKGLIIRHSCDVMDCINPDHILLGTYANNMADCIARGRHVVSYDGAPRNITDETVKQIKLMSKNYNCAHIARHFGISRSHAWRIVTGVSRGDNNE